MTEQPKHMPEQIRAGLSNSVLQDLGTADGYIDEILEITNHISELNDFSEDEIRFICHNMHCFAAPRDYVLLDGESKHCGEMEYLLLILTGAARLKHISMDGCEVVTELAAGSILSEVSMVDGKAHLVSCAASRPMDFAVLTREGLNRILLQAPRLGNKILLALLDLLSSRLREINHYLLPSLA